MRIGPLQAPVIWYAINYIGTQITQWDFQNKGKSGWTVKSSFVLEVPLCYLRPSIIYSVPRDQIVQRAYCVITNSPFPSSPKLLHQSEAWCTTIHMKMSLICKWMKSHFHMKGWAPRLALMNRFKEIRKWPITLCHFRFRETITFVWLLRIQWHGNCDSSCTVDHPSGDHSKENRVSTTARFYALVKRGSVTVFGLHVLIWIVENLKIVAY